MAKRRLDCVATAMQQYEWQLSRWTVDLVIHPKAVDGRISSLLQCAGVHGETTILQ
jgi:hypothetical protein